MNRSDFYTYLRRRGSGVFGTSLSTSQVQGCEAILDEAEKKNTQLKWLAYMLATAYHETAHTMKPIAEYGKGRGRKYGVKGKYGQVPYGRGYVQLTWDYNYENADQKLGLNGRLLKNFDLALDPNIAAQIMFKGMEEGWFTQRKLSHYITDAKTDYVGARKIINGTDKDDLIAGYAVAFEKALVAADYGKDAKPAPAPSLPETGPIPVPRPVPPVAEPVKTEPKPAEPAKVPQTGKTAAVVVAAGASAGTVLYNWWDSITTWIGSFF